MKVILAKKAGFCMGVKRAMDIVLKMSEDSKNALHTYGPIIHNPQVIDLLEKKNIHVVTDLNKASIDIPLIIRTHGITPQKREEIKDLGLKLKDATCPLVMKVQSIIKKHANNGYFIVIIGDEGHAEVDGLMGFTNGNGVVINSVAEAKELPDKEKVCVVAQTTLDVATFVEISNFLSKRFNECIITNTICDATEKRQTEAIEICKLVDAIIIVGGKNSANTTRLANICTSSGIPTFFVETADELHDCDLEKYNTIGVTAGASTPNWIISKVVERVEGVEKKSKNFILRKLIDTFEFLVKSNLYTAFGGGCVTYTSCVLQDIKPSVSLFLISILYLFSMYVLNNFTDEGAIQFTTPDKTEFLIRNKSYFVTWGIAALLLSVLISFGLGVLSSAFLILSSLLGVAYSVKVVPNKFSSFLKYKRLKDIPGSKDIFVSLAWSVVTVLIPVFSSNEGYIKRESVLTFLFVFIVVYIRSVIFDVKDIQGDKIVGRETIPILIGKEKTKVFLFIVAFILAVFLIVVTYFGWLSSLGYLLLVSVLYICSYLYLYHRRIIYKGVSFEGVVDGKFILIGALTALWV